MVPFVLDLIAWGFPLRQSLVHGVLRHQRCTLRSTHPDIGNGTEVLAANAQTIAIARIEISKTTILRAANFINFALRNLA